MGNRFREAMDVACVTPKELAERMGVHVQSVKQARMDPDSTGYRSPPAGWQAVLLEVASQRLRSVGGLMADLITELEGNL